MEKIRLISIQIGLPKIISDDLGTWETAFFKEPVTGSIFLGENGLRGDEPANKVHHGGVEKAILMYSAEHYPLWETELGRAFPYGGFAENLTVTTLDENSVCIGDIFQIGDVILQVTQARVPCSKIPRRWGIPDLMERVLATGRFGWYCRVLKEGTIEAGTTVKLVERPHPEWPIKRAFSVYTEWKKDIESLQALAACPALSKDWFRDIQRRLEKNGEG